MGADSLIGPPPPTLTKRIERAFKYVSALLAAALLWRPGRRARALKKSLGAYKKVLLVRLDNRLGEVLLTTPLLSALKAVSPPPQVDVLLHPQCVRVLEGHPGVDRLISFEPRRFWALRRAGYEVVLNCANWGEPSVTSAIVARLIARRSMLIGSAVSPVGWLHDCAVSPLTATRNEVAQRLHLLSPLGIALPSPKLSFRTPVARPQIEHFLTELGPLDSARGGRSEFAVLNPGGRLDWRRIPLQAFVDAASALVKAGLVPVVTWGPGEEMIAEKVVQNCPGAKKAPPTDLDGLAALIGRARLTVCGNTGPMHLSVAIGTPTLAFFLHMDMERWGHAVLPHRMIDLTPSLRQGADICAEVSQLTSVFARAALPR